MSFSDIQMRNVARLRMQPAPSGGLKLRAPAKINLNLLVGPAREDGFHPLDSYVAKITLYDELTLASRDDAEIRLDCAGADCGPVRKNLAYRAAVRLAEEASGCGVDMELIKRIPPQSGLGGGSSDAAAVLLGLNALWELNLSIKELSGIAAELGSDVPLFLGPPASRMTGRGEVLHPAEVREFTAILLTPPDCACSTKDVYDAFDAQNPEKLEEQLPAELLLQPCSRLAEHLRNDLSNPAQQVSPRLAEYRRSFARALKTPAHITGSGSAIFALFDDEQEAITAGRKLDDELSGNCMLVQMNPW